MDSYSFIPTLLKLYRCYNHGLKTCMLFEYNPQMKFCHFFRNLNLDIFWTFCVCVQLLLQFNVDFFIQTLQVILTWYEDTHVV